MLKTRSRSLNTTQGRQRMSKSQSINHLKDKSTDKNRRSYRELSKRSRQEGQKNNSRNFMKSRCIAEMTYHELQRENKQNIVNNRQFNNKKLSQKDENQSICQKNPQKIISIPISFLTNQQNLQEFTNKYLQIKEYQPIPLNRARMIDWLLEVCSAFELRWQVFWGAVQLLDILIQQFNYVRCSNIHVVGITCLFISQKFFSYIPLHIDQIVQKALHNAYPASKLLKEQLKIIKKLTQSKKPLSFYTTIYTLYLNHTINTPTNNEKHHHLNFTQKQKIQLMRQLIIIWMDPLQCFGGKEFAKQMPEISYQGVFRAVVGKIRDGRDFGQIQEVGKQYQQKYKCLNVNDYRMLGKIVF